MNYEPLFDVVLHTPEIPQNTGNIGRSCVALGAKLWMIRPLGFSLDDYYLRRAGLDYWQHLEWEAVDSWAEVRAKIGEDRRWWYLTKTASREYTDVAFAPRDVLVFGCESKGLPPEILAAAGQQALRVPMREQVRSINLASCAAVVMYEAARQFKVKGEM